MDAGVLTWPDSMPTTGPVQTSTTAKETEAASLPRMSLPKLFVFNWSSFFFAVLQSVCSGFIALNSVRFLVGIGAFAAASGALHMADRLHIDAIRIPMMILALLGSAVNLIALGRVQSLRKRPASAWRQKPISREKQRSEFFQFILSVLTLALLAAELAAHHYMAVHH